MQQDKNDEITIAMLNEMRRDMQSRTLDSATSAERTMQIVVTLAAATAAAVMTQRRLGVVLVAAPAFGFVLVYQCQLYARLWATTWKELDLTARIETILDREIFGHSAGDSLHPRSNPSMSILIAAAILAFFGATAFGFWVLARGDYPLASWLAYSAFVALDVLGLIYGALELSYGWLRAVRLSQMFAIDPEMDYVQRTDELVRLLGVAGRLWVRTRRGVSSRASLARHPFRRSDLMARRDR